MPTAKKRINITVDDELYAALEKLSAKRSRSVSSVSVALLEQALELQEDIHFARVADERSSRDERRVPHDAAWDD